MPRINKTQYALLGLLNMKGPSTGYELKAFINESLVYFWQENYGHIYPVLKRLVESGWVIVRTEANPGRPDKKIYSITMEGRKELKHWKETPCEFMKIKNEMLLRIFLSGPEENINIKRMVQREEKQHLALMEEYREAERHVRECHGESPILLTLDFGKRYSQSIIEWCRDVRSKLEENDE